VSAGSFIEVTRQNTLDKRAVALVVERGRFVGVLRCDGFAMDHAGAIHHVGGDIDGDDEVRAQRPAYGHRHRVNERAVEQPALANAHRFENAGQGVGGADRQRQRAALQPHFMPCADFRRDSGERNGQILDFETVQFLLQRRLETFAGDQTTAGKGQIHQRENTPTRQRAGEGFNLVETVRRIAAADNGPDRRAGDNVRMHAMRGEFAQDAYMRPATRGAGAQRQTNKRSLAVMLMRTAGGVFSCGGFVLLHVRIDRRRIGRDDFLDSFGVTQGKHRSASVSRFPQSSQIIWARS
jgi:hypothetical protein